MIRLPLPTTRGEWLLAALAALATWGAAHMLDRVAFGFAMQRTSAGFLQSEPFQPDARFVGGLSRAQLNIKETPNG